MPEFKRPFPALTPAQRLHLEVYGYVVIERAIDESLVKRLRDKTYEIEEEFRRTGAFKGCAKSLFSQAREYFRIDNLPHVDPAYLEYLTHPYLVGMAEEAIGGDARLEQSDAHIRRPPADKGAQGYGFHRGCAEPMTWRGSSGLFQCHFVKTLTNLTDLGPDDGGTSVIPGSHKIAHVDEAATIAAAMKDPGRLIHSVVAPAGSTLLFFEATLHSGGLMRSDNDRVLIIGGYTPTMFQPWAGYDPEPDFVERSPEELRPLLTGSARYHWNRRVRSLRDEAAALP